MAGSRVLGFSRIVEPSKNTASLWEASAGLEPAAPAQSGEMSNVARSVRMRGMVATDTSRAARLRHKDRRLEILQARADVPPHAPPGARRAVAARTGGGVACGCDGPIGGGRRHRQHA